MTSPISATNTAAHTGPIPGICLDHPIPASLARRAAIHPSAITISVSRVSIDPQVGVDPGPVRPIQRCRGELGAPARPEQLLDRQVQALLGQHGVHPGLEPGADDDQLRAVADQLAQLPHLRWGDPRLGQPAHPQQIRQIGGVAHVVLHPPIGEPLDPHGRNAKLQLTVLLAPEEPVDGLYLHPQHRRRPRRADALRGVDV